MEQIISLSINDLSRAQLAHLQELFSALYLERCYKDNEESTSVDAVTKLLLEDGDPIDTIIVEDARVILCNNESHSQGIQDEFHIVNGVPVLYTQCEGCGHKGYITDPEFNKLGIIATLNWGAKIGWLCAKCLEDSDN